MVEAAEAAAVRTQAIVDRLEALPATGLRLRARIVVGAATFFDGFDVVAIGTALPVLVDTWGLSPREVGYLISAGFVGQLIGSLAFPRLAERIGRLQATAWSVAVFGVMSLFCAGAQTYLSLVGFRFIQGIGLGGELPVAATYINEIASAEGRGRFVVFYEIVFPLGLLASTILGLWIVPSYGWRPLFVVAGLPAIVAVLLRLMLPESPRWLASKERFEEAEAAVARFEHSVRPNIGSLPHRVAAAAACAPTATRWSEIFDAQYLRRTLIAWTVWFSGGFISNALTSWFPTIYRTMFDVSVQDALRYGIATTFAGVIGSALCALVIDHIGRRRWMSISFAACALSFLSMLLIGTPSVEVVVGFVAVAFGLVSTAFITAYAYTPEIYPTRMRACGCGTASAVLRLGGAIAPTLIGILVADYSLNSVFVMLAVVSLFASIMVGLFAIETKGRVLEEISR